VSCVHEMARAISSFPVPVSPSMRAVELVGATIRTRSNTSRRALLAPTMSSKAVDYTFAAHCLTVSDATVENNAEEVDSAVRARKCRPHILARETGLDIISILRKNCVSPSHVRSPTIRWAFCSVTPGSTRG